MKDQFVPSNLALQMKELGFARPCVAWINTRFPNVLHWENQLSYKLSSHGLPMPLWQQAFDWFSDNKKMSSHIIDREHETDVAYWRIIIKGDKTGTLKGYSKFEKSRQEARIACLTKLIELCKK